MPPPMDHAASGCRSSQERTLASTRSCSARVQARTSTVNAASAGTVLEVVPDVITVGVTDVPRERSAQVTASVMKCAASTDAFIPRSGSRPACAARPVKVR